VCGVCDDVGLLGGLLKGLVVCLCGVGLVGVCVRVMKDCVWMWMLGVGCG